MSTDRKDETIELPVDRQVFEVTATLAQTDTPHLLPRAGSAEFPTIAGYTILGECGRGGMGTVFKAHEVSANRIVALKVIRADRLSELDADSRRQWLSRFHAEIEAAAHLEHTNIVPVYDVGGDEASPYFTMRFVEGDSLARRMQGTGNTPDEVRARARLLAQVARAVNFAHQHGVLHRDLKPGNILVDADHFPHLTDFGLAKRLDKQPGTGDSSRAKAEQEGSTLVGTVSYMAPEQAAGNASLTTAVDIYALGAILYEILTKRPPFLSKSPDDVMETLRQVIEVEPSAPRHFWPGAPRDLEAICQKCMAKDPRNRYGSAEAVAQDLERYLDGRPTRVRPGPRWERALKWIRRKPAQAALVAVIAGALVSLVAGGLWYNAKVQDALVKTRRYLYAADMNLALDEWRQGYDSFVLARLAHHWPESGQLELRGFEWYYLWRLANHGSTLRGHSGPVFAVAFSPDGRTIATASSDGTVRLWDRATYQPIDTLRGHTGPISGLAFGPDGRLLASAGEDKTVRLWDCSTHKQISIANGFGSPFSCVAFNPNDPILVAGGHDGQLHSWNVAAGDLQDPRALPGHALAVRCAVFSPDGKTLASGGEDSAIKLWQVELNNLRPIREIKDHTDEVWNLAFSPDGKRLASTGTDDPGLVSDVDSGKPLLTLKGPNRAFLSVAFAPDGATLATGGRNGLVSLWNAPNGEQLTRLEGHAGPVYSVAFSPDQRALLSGSADSTVRVWDLDHEIRRRGPREGCRKIVLPGSGRVRAAAFRADGELVATPPIEGTSPPVITLWEVITGREAVQIPVPEASGQGTALSFSTDGTLLVMGGEHGVNAWSVKKSATWQARHLWTWPSNSRVLTVAISPDGHTVATGAADERIHLLDTATGAQRKVLKGHHGEVAAVAFSPSGKLLAPGSYDRTVKLWPLPDGQELPALVGESHADWVTGLSFSPDGRTLASAADDCTIKLWDIAKHSQLASLQGTAGWPRCLTFSPDGKTLVTGSDDLAVKLWDPVSGRVCASLDGHAGLPCAIFFSPDGKTLSTIGEDRFLLRWQAATDAEVLQQRR